MPASVVLRPCHIRGSRVVPLRDRDPVEVDWSGLTQLVVPEDAAPDMRVAIERHLRTLRVGDFTGTILTHAGRLAALYLGGDARYGRAGQLGSALKRDPSLPDRIRSVYRVEAVSWPAVLQEAVGR